jgi:hypothetical protein
VQAVVVFGGAAVGYHGDAVAVQVVAGVGVGDRDVAVVAGDHDGEVVGAHHVGPAFRAPWVGTQ